MLTRQIIGWGLVAVFLYFLGSMVSPTPTKAQGGFSTYLPITYRAIPPALPLSAYRGLISVSDGNDTDIYTLRADGSDIVTLTDNTEDDHIVGRAPNGEWIAYINTFGTGEARQSQLWLVRPDGTDTRLLAELPGFIAVLWSPNSTQLAVIQSDDFSFHLYLASPDQTTPQSISVTGTTINFAEWAPDGSAFAYAVNTDTQGEFDMWVLSPTDGSTMRVAQRIQTGKWSPDSSRIGFVSAIGETGRDIGWVRPDGTELTYVTQSPADDGDFVWIEGGARMVVTRRAIDSGQSDQIIAFSLDGETEDVLYSPSSPAGLLSVSPDGSQLLWYQSEPENENLWWQPVDSDDPVLLGGFRNTTLTTPVRWSDDQAYATWGEHYESFPSSGYYLVPIVDFTATPPTLHRGDITTSPQAQNPLWLPDTHILSLNYRAELQGTFLPTLWQVENDTYSTIPFGEQLLSFDISTWWVEAP